ncbi:hypothetical protein [Modestobacter sp. SYSU DS0290]
MSEPQHPHQPSPGVPGEFPAQQPAGWWPAAQAPTWQPAAVPAAAPAGRAPGLTTGVALAVAGVVAVGLVLAAVLGALVVRSGADELGRSMGQAMGESSMAAMDEVMGGLGGGWGAEDPWAAEPVEQFDPTAPTGLGADPALDAYAQQCFDGDLQSCDDLYAGAPPLSDYERYATTCGGRVKEFAVLACTELD